MVFLWGLYYDTILTRRVFEISSNKENVRKCLRMLMKINECWKARIEN